MLSRSEKFSSADLVVRSYRSGIHGWLETHKGGQGVKNLDEISFHLCSLGVLLGQLTATFRAHCRFVSVFIHIVTGRVLTPTPSSCCRQSQILKK